MLRMSKTRSRDCLWLSEGLSRELHEVCLLYYTTSIYLYTRTVRPLFANYACFA